MLRRFEFGLEAIKYIREELAKGKTLASFLLELPLEAGSVFAYLSPSLTLEEVQDFNHWNVRKIDGQPMPRAERQWTLQDFVVSYLRESERHYVIVEDEYALPHDPWIESRRHPVFFHSSEVYHFRDNQRLEQTTTRREVPLPSDYPAIGIMTSLPSGEPSIQDLDELTTDKLKQLVIRTQYIIVGAYDNEAELIWSAESPR